MESKKLTKAELAKECDRQAAENRVLKAKSFLLHGEVSRVLETFDKAVDEILDDATATKLRLKISELNKPAEPEPEIILLN